MTQNELQSHLVAFISFQDDSAQLSKEDVEFMSFSMSNFIADATIKYLKGQKEHGGSIFDRDLEHERYMEQIDGFWYEWARAYKQTRVDKATFISGISAPPHAEDSPE